MWKGHGAFLGGHGVEHVQFVDEEMMMETISPGKPQKIIGKPQEHDGLMGCNGI